MRFWLARCLVAFACVPAFAAEGTEQRSQAGQPASTDKFTAIRLPGVNNASRYVAASAMVRILASVQRHGCSKEAAIIYRKPGSKAVLILVPCYPPLVGTPESERYYAFVEYPLTLFVYGGEVVEVDLSKHGFMYQSGSISAVTDIDKNGKPEIWLSGSICECDGEPSDYGPEGCECDGGSVLELRNGVLHKWVYPKRQNPGSSSR